MKRTNTDLPVVATAQHALRTRAVVDPNYAAPAVPGFVVSRFAPTIFDAAARVLADANLTVVERERMLVLLLTPRGDTETRSAVLEAIAEGRRLSPLLFVQSTPSSIIGKVGSQWGIRGAITTVSTPRGLDDPVILEMAEELLRCDNAHAILVLREVPPEGDLAGAAEAAVLTLELCA